MSTHKAWTGYIVTVVLAFLAMMGLGDAPPEGEIADAVGGLGAILSDWLVNLILALLAGIPVQQAVYWIPNRPKTGGTTLRSPAVAVAIAMAATMLMLGACQHRVEGPDPATLAPEEAARLHAFDAIAAYEPVQILLEQAVLNPDVPAEVKRTIGAVDASATAAIHAYLDAVEQYGPGGDITVQRLVAVLAALQQAQALLPQITGGGG